MTWASEQRLRFIERRLKRRGKINIRDLVEKFGISDRQASYDMAAYLERAPGNMVHDPVRKAYVREDGFRAVLTAGS